jgi:diguanylate cyclase (GGDEF)-like protein
VINRDISLRRQIVLLCSSLVILTSVVIQTISWWSTNNYNNKQISSNIEQARIQFSQYLQQKEELLTTSARVLTADFGFKQAVSTRDKDTIVSVLDNHASRINADIMLLADLNGDLLSSSLSSNNDMAEPESVAELISQLTFDDEQSHFVYIGNTLYQVLVLAVKAPRVIAYAYIGFAINKPAMDKLKALTDLDISFFNTQGDVLLTTINPTDATAISTSYLIEETLPWLFWQRPRYNNNEFILNSQDIQPISVFLTADLSPIYAEYDTLLATLFIIATVILFISIIISTVVAQNLTRPLSYLIESTRDFARGEYKQPSPPANANHEITALFNAFSDMGENIKSREEHILFQAEHDFLTQLYNRRSFRNIIDYYIQNFDNFLLVTVNVRGIENINDMLGTIIGDKSLQAIGLRLTEQLDSTYQHARLDGVTFSSLIPLKQDENKDIILKRYTDILLKPYDIDGLDINLKFWAGIAIYPLHGEDADTLSRRSTIGLEGAEKEHTVHRYYHNGEDEAHLKHLKIIEDLRTAVDADDGQLYMNYQPKMNLNTNKIDKVESLIRWEHPEIGFISPELFIAYAEQTGIIFDLTYWVVNSVVRQVAEWKQQGLDIHAAINVSAQDINHPDFYNNLQTVTKRYAVAPSSITLEVTERDLMHDEEQAIALLIKLKKMGYTISVDDYGIGQSSLAKLKQLPVDELKIDKSFVMQLNESESDQIIVNSTILLGHRLGLTVVAEGLENSQSLAILKSMKCDHIQGYFLSKPMSAIQFVTWLRSQHDQNI